MRSPILSLGLFLSLLLIGCQGANSEVGNQTDAPEEEVATSTEVEALYESAAVYAGKTEYRFFTEEGQAIMISEGNEEGTQIKKSVDLLENDEDLEGPPGAESTLIGKKFTLGKDENGAVVEINLIDGQKIYDRVALAQYQGAAQFPADMQYFFTMMDDGTDKIIYVSNDEETPSIKIPANLLEDPADLAEDETMLGPNPKVEGWYYLFSYEGEELKEISPVPGQEYNEEEEAN
ncbi:MAG: hypothetical protein KTR30_07245 [Saprospiraceae bacterium]|nr:hypothetical protein [Saprospiraceae bacterium]